MAKPSTFRSNPLRLLLPFGYFCLVFGLGVWSFDLPHQGPEPTRVHAILLGNGFLFAFALGILLTGVPALLRTPPMSLPRFFLLLLTLALMGLAAVNQRVFHAQLFHLLSALNVAAYLWKSLASSGSRGHPGPRLALAATLVACAGSALFLLTEASILPWELGRWGVVAGFQGFFLLFCVACVRWSRPSTTGAGGKIPDAGFLWMSLALLAISLGLEAMAWYAFQPERWYRGAYLLRAAWLVWALARPKGTFTILEGFPLHGFALRGGLSLVLAGTLIACINPGRTVLFNHVTYLGGFTLIALSVATGMIASRLGGNRKTGLWTLALGGVCLSAALALRLAAGYAEGARMGLLTAAGIFALAPVFIWAVAFFPSLADPTLVMESPGDTPSTDQEPMQQKKEIAK